MQSSQEQASIYEQRNANIAHELFSRTDINALEQPYLSMAVRGIDTSSEQCCDCEKDHYFDFGLLRSAITLLVVDDGL